MPENYRDLFQNKILFYRRIFFVIIGLCALFNAAAIAVLVYYVRMTNGNYFTVLMVLFGLLLFTGIAVAVTRFFKTHLEVIRMISDSDLEALEKLSKSRWWMEKYLPSFIISSGKITIFKLFRQTDLYFTEISQISIRPNYLSKGRQNKLVIFKKSDGGSYFFGIDSNPFQIQHLLDKAVEYNPDIIIKSN